MTTLDLALITYGTDGIRRVSDMSLPRIDGVRYIVSWQDPGDAAVPEALRRDDVEIHTIEGRGAAINRNNAMAHCRADLVLFADDDIIYNVEGLRAVIDTFDRNPDVALATFMARHPNGPQYPTTECRLTDPLPRGYWVSSYCIAFRRTAISDLECHPEFGAGAPRLSGADDSLFLLAAIRRGLNCRFFPVNICEHPTLSTGTLQKMPAGNLRALGCYIALAYPATCLPRLVLKAARTARSGQSGFGRALRYLLSGATDAPRIWRGNPKYTWRKV